jgi:hypothetical protein
MDLRIESKIKQGEQDVTVLDVCADNIKSWRETLNNVEEGEKESIMQLHSICFKNLAIPAIHSARDEKCLN